AEISWLGLADILSDFGADSARRQRLLKFSDGPLRRRVVGCRVILRGDDPERPCAWADRAQGDKRSGCLDELTSIQINAHRFGPRNEKKCDRLGAQER